MWNSITAGAVTGGVLAARQGVAAASVSAAIGNVVYHNIICIYNIQSYSNLWNLFSEN